LFVAAADAVKLSKVRRPRIWLASCRASTPFLIDASRMTFPVHWFQRTISSRDPGWLCLLACVVAGCWWCTGLLAQEEKVAPEPTSPPPAAVPAATPPASPVKPFVGPQPLPASDLDTFLLRDSKGNLVPMIGLTFEDFEKLVRLKKGIQPPSPPAFTIDSVNITGKAAGEVAELQASISVRIRQSGWVKVPLRLSPAALVEPPKYQGPGEHIFVSGADAEGYVLWLQGEGKSHQLHLKLALPIKDASGERRLQLPVPQATESVLRLQVPLAPVAAQLKNGSEGILTTRPAGNQQTDIQVVGLSGELQLAWQEGRPQARTAKPALEAPGGEIIVRVESRNRISAEARLKVRTLGKPIDKVSVRLPPGMQLVPTPATGYVVTPADAAAAPEDAKNPAGRVVDVQFDRPTVGPIEIRLLTEQDIPAGGEGAVRPGRFEVLGAQRQRGTIDFLVEGDWNLNWTDEGSTRRTELSEATFGTSRPVARFEYFKQPLDLRLAITPRPTRVAVEPQYQVFVEATRLRLEAVLRFRIRGPKATTANLDLAGWKIDRVMGENSAEQPLPPADGVLTLLLPLGQFDPAKGEVTYRLSGHQPLATDSEQVQFSLPRAQVDVAAPASISIQPADNVELSPSSNELKGLVADSTSNADSSAGRQQLALIYRDLGATEPILFVGKRQIRSRLVSVQANTTLTFRRQVVEVEQRLNYQIAYEPKRSYLLAAPTGAGEIKNFQVTIDGELVEHRPADGDEPGKVIEVLDLEDHLGPVELEVRYSLLMPELKSNEASTLNIPLLTPLPTDVDRVLGQTTRLEYTEELSLKLPEQNTAIKEELVPSGRGMLEGKSEQLLPSLQVEVALLQTPDVSSLVIDRLWIQTWLSPLQRQERCVWQIRTSAESLLIRLPAEADAAKLSTLVDGLSAAAVVTTPGLVRIDLPEVRTSRPRVVELWYAAPSSPTGWGLTTRRLAPPQAQGAFAPQRMYWQVMLPSNEHLVFDPPNYATAMKWAWKGYFWSRVADLSQRQLEDWCQASRQEPFPETLNNYLFANVGTEAAVELQTVPQRTLAGCLAGLGLVLGLLILHVPQVRGTTGLIILSAAALACGLAAPQTTLFAAQAVAVGLVIVALLAALRWLWTGRVAMTPPITTRAASQISASRSGGSRAGSAPPATTAAVAALPSSPQEVES
jgi:hypothetical protein